VVVWPDGTVMRAQINAASQRVQITPASGASIGLFGDFDGDPDNDFFTRDGEVLSPDVVDDFETFYGTYVDSWRITDAESAFYYEEGQSTETFADRSFPARAASADDLPAEIRAEAEELCRRAGVTLEQVFAACVLDLGATGEPAFAYQAYLAEQAIPTPGERPTATPGPTGSGPNTLIFGDTQIAFGPNPPVVDTSGPAPSWTCEASDGVFTIINSFTESPLVNYELNIQYIAPDNARGLAEAFRLIVRRNRVDYAWVQTIAEQFADAVGSVALDGAILTAEGELFVNDPPTIGLGPINLLPAGSELTPFTLQAACSD
jgi:hypothetical protein